MATDDSTIVLMYHRVADEGPDPHGLQVAPERFAAQLEVLGRHTEIVPLTAVTARSRSARAAITFDDGYRDNLTNARPVLTRLGVPATVFVTSGFVGSEAGFWTDRLAALLLGGELPVAHLDLELGGSRLLMDVHSARSRERAYRFLHHRLRLLGPDAIDAALSGLSAAAGTRPPVPESALPLTAEQLRELARGDTVSIGAHSVTHPRLSALDESAQRSEMTESRQCLEDLLHVQVRSFAYPYGTADTINETSVAIARELYDLAVTTDAAPVVATTDTHRIPRFNVGNWPAEEFRARLARWLAH